MRRLPLLAAAASVAVLSANPCVVFGQQARSRTLSVHQKTLQAVAPPQASTLRPASSLDVVAWVDRADSTYALGESVRVFVQTNKDAYVTVLNVDPNGETTVLFPNRYQSANFVPANRPLEVPAPNSQSRLVVTGSVGTEMLKVLASTERVPWLDAVRVTDAGPFRVVRDRPRRTARSLRVAMNRTSVGEATPPRGSEAPAAGVPRHDAEMAMCHTTIQTIRTPNSRLQRTRSLRVQRTARDGASAVCDADAR